MNSNKIDVTYTQTGNVCVFASYAIIMNYFSEGKESIEGLIDRYIEVFDIDRFSDVKERENSICKHYHDHCEANGLRGFQFIACQHDRNVFSTRQYCSAVKVEVMDGINPLDEIHKLYLREELKKGGLAMILIKVPFGTRHAIVVGFDQSIDRYFYRNPEKYENEPLLKREDFLNLEKNHIYEYILFERANID